MGDMILGALLGANQSFEGSTLAPWVKASEQASAYLVGSGAAVHSSTTALYIVAGSTAGPLAAVSYAHGTPFDAGRAAFPETTTHGLRSWAWARATDAPSSGQAYWRIATEMEALSSPIAAGPVPTRYEAFTWAASPAGFLETGLRRMAGAGAMVSFTVDDVLTQLDPVTLHPEWTAEEQSALLQAQHRTQSGQLQSVLWGRYFAWNLPLHAISGIEAGIILWWWELSLPLAVTLDSSDSATVFTCRIANSRQPIGKRVRPYADRWSGTLVLESLDGGSLVF